MIVVGTGGTDTDDTLELRLVDHMPEDTVRRWTAAYITHAEEKHAEGRPWCSVRRWRDEGLVHSSFIVCSVAGARLSLSSFYILQ